MNKAEYAKYSRLFPSKNASFSLTKICYLCHEAGYNYTSTDIVWGNGNLKAGLMIVGQDSAGLDKKASLWRGSRSTLIPLSNKKTGAKFRIMLHKAGIDPFSVYITNTVKCNIGIDKWKLSYNQVCKPCIQHLKSEIEIVKPKIIVTLGSKVKDKIDRMLSITKRLRIKTIEITEFIGEVPPFIGEDEQKNQYEIFNLKHPSYVEGIKRESNYIKNLKRIKRRLK